MSDFDLSSREREQVVKDVERVVRERLNERKPDPSQYAAPESKSVRFIGDAMNYAKVLLPVIAVVGLIASSIRTVTTGYEIYLASGVSPIASFIAALALTIASEGALVILSAVHMNQRIKWRIEKKKRNITTLRTIFHSILVRLGVREPVRYDEMPESDNIGFILIVVFLFTLTANLYLGMRAMFANSTDSLQVFLSNLINAPAGTQIQFIIDMVAAIFPPGVAYLTGHLTAWFAAEVAERRRKMESVYESDMQRWFADWQNPLETSDAAELMELRIEEKLAAKRAKAEAAARAANLQRISIERPERPQIAASAVSSQSSQESLQRDDDAPERARQMLEENPHWKASDLIRAGIKKTTAYKVYGEVKGKGE